MSPRREKIDNIINFESVKLRFLAGPSQNTSAPALPGATLITLL